MRSRLLQDATDDAVTMDTLVILEDHHRRLLLRYFVETSDRTASIDECVSYILQAEMEGPGEPPSRDGVEIALHHIHIPKLADAGILEYDARHRTVRYRGHDRLEASLCRDLSWGAD